MKAENAIEVKNVTKSFKVFLDKGHTLKERMIFWKRNKHEVRHVLNGISFDVKKGEAIGLIGHNGCGKSTTLKLLTKIMYPDSGSIEMHGRVCSLIELGAGFHPDMSGRENIYINASIFGLKRKEIDARLNDIIAFSELEQFIDNPVRTYSSGMYMRLAFSVAINVNADILLIDEILAVGDVNFQSKCFERLKEIKKQGTTIVIVSHALQQIEEFCERSIWIHEGKIRKEGAPGDVHPVYIDYMTGAAKRSAAGNEANDIRWGSRDAEFKDIRLLGENGEEKDSFSTGEALTIEMDYVVHNPLRDPVCGIGIFRKDGLQCYGTNTSIDKLSNPELGKGGTVTFHVDHNWLLPGEYTLEVALHTVDGFPYDYYRFAKHFTMYSELNEAGTVRMDHEWHFQQGE